MAVALVVLAIGSVLAGYVGMPNSVVSGGNRIETFLAPSFTRRSARRSQAAPEPAAPSRRARERRDRVRA